MSDNNPFFNPSQTPPAEVAANLETSETQQISISPLGEAATTDQLEPPLPAAATTPALEESQRSSSPVPGVSSPARLPTTSTSPRSATDVSDPRVAALRAMFPDYDELILQSVLQSVNGSQDAAIDLLLGMSDPEYTSDAHPQEPILSQTDLDEQLARRLMLEEQEAQQRQWAAQHPQPVAPQRRNSRPYQVYQQQHHQQGVPPDGEKDTMAEFQEQFNKIAETGKKTFGNIFSKVKAKIQEYDQGRSGQSSSGGYDPNPQQQQPYYGQSQPTITQPRPQQPAYYDPNLPMPPPTSAITATPAALQGYDMTMPPTAPPTASLPPPTSPPPASASRASSDVPRPPQTGTGMPINAGKLGLLPKRPVSLLPDPATTPTHVEQMTDEDDGLEYVENPFEDTRK